jgi:Fe-S-cluster-containing hydrogenase component 2
MTTDKTFIAHPGKCTGCSICELICSLEHTGEFRPKAAHIRIMRNRELMVNIPVLKVGCDRCGGDPQCVANCPYDALEYITWEEAARLRREHPIGSMPMVLMEDAAISQRTHEGGGNHGR